MEKVIDWAVQIPASKDNQIGVACNKLLNRFTCKQITNDEFEVELCKIAIKTLDELVFQGPPEKPSVLQEFEDAKKTTAWLKKSRTEQDEIRRRVCGRKEVADYLDKTMSVVSQCVSNAKWLEWLIETLIKHGEKDGAAEVWKVYNAYPPTLWYQERQVWTRKKY